MPAEKNASTWDFAPAREAARDVRIAKCHHHFIAGQWTAPAEGNYFTTRNPATGRKLSEIAKGSTRDVDAAVRAARAAYRGTWGKMPPRERGKFLFRIARIIQERSRELAIIETLDGGKPIRESRDIDIPLAANHFFYHAGWADKLDYAFPNRRPGPLGVAGQIIPWNFPLLMAAWKIAPALACGNTVVLKPAETTSLTALRLAGILAEAGLPEGVVNIVTGPDETGASLVEHDDLDKIAFTGSTEVGKMIQRTVAGRRRNCTLELGGKAANIILEDAPIDQAVEGIVNGIYFNQGHVCCAGSRLFVQEPVYDEVLEKLKRRIDTLLVGDPLDKNTDIGAINSKGQLATIKRYIRIGQEEGATLYQPPGCRLPGRGYFCPPSLFTGVSQSSILAREEIFGPVLAVQTFRTVPEVIEKANNTPYGLSAGVWCDKGSRLFHLTGALDAGVVWANTYNKFDPASPFGGFKESGFGREGGLHGLASYLEL